jgi:hypothetical protein
MLIVETFTFAVGDFSVQQRPLRENPAWAVYIVSLAGRVIGRQISRPSESDCRWLLLHQDGHYHEPQPSITFGYTAATKRRQERLRREAKEAALAD